MSLADGSGRLQRHNGVGTTGQLLTLTPQTDRPAGDQHHLITTLHGSGDRGSIALDHGSRVTAQQAGAQLHHPQHHAAGAPRTRARRRSRR